jgi:hypothetical protein
MSTPSQQQSPADSKSSPFPVNRVVAFMGPFVAILAGACATWLGQHFPGLHLNTSKVAGQITQAIEFAIGAGITFALQHKWLAGWQQWEALTAAPATAQPTPPFLPIDPTAPYSSLDPVSAADMLYPPDAFPLQPPLEAPEEFSSPDEPAPVAEADRVLTAADLPEGDGQAGDG